MKASLIKHCAQNDPPPIHFDLAHNMSRPVLVALPPLPTTCSAQAPPLTILGKERRQDTVAPCSSEPPGDPGSGIHPQVIPGRRWVGAEAKVQFPILGNIKVILQGDEESFVGLDVFIGSAPDREAYGIRFIRQPAAHVRQQPDLAGRLAPSVSGGKLQRRGPPLPPPASPAAALPPCHCPTLPLPACSSRAATPTLWPPA